MGLRGQNVGGGETTWLTVDHGNEFDLHLFILHQLCAMTVLGTWELTMRMRPLLSSRFLGEFMEKMMVDRTSCQKGKPREVI